MKILTKILGLCCCLATVSAGATCLSSDRLTGVNIAGAEFGEVPGRLNYDYIYPSSQELEKLAEFGGNIIRLPIRWERIRPEANGVLNAGELQQIVAVYETAKTLGVCVIVDLHNYAQYYGKSLKTNAALKSAFTNTWLQLAAALPDTRYVALGLMNEPAHMPVLEWAQLAQRTLNELRKKKHAHLILVAGGRWSGVHDWFSGNQPDVNANAFAKFADPMDNYAIEVHQYADSDSSGMHAECRAREDFTSVFGAISDWAILHGHELFLGEFGVGRDARCLDTLDAFLQLTKAAPWRGWTYWAAGRWWGNYPMAVSLESMSDSPQWGVLNPFLMNERDDISSAADQSLQNVVIEANTVLKPGVSLGKNTKFASALSIPAGLDLTGALRTLAWDEGDKRGVVDLNDDVLLPVSGTRALTLLDSIESLQQYGAPGSAVRQGSNGVLLIDARDYDSALLPVRVSMAEADDREGSHVNEDGDIVFVTSNRRVVLGYPALRATAAFEAVLDSLGLQLRYDERANIVGEPQVASSFYFSARPDVTILPAVGAEAGIMYDSVPGLPNATLASVTFEDENGDLQAQAIVPVPADWMQLKAALAALPGMTAVQIDALGVISVLRNGVPMKARSGFRVNRGAAVLAEPDHVVFQSVGDANGDGRDDFSVIYPNGDEQLLLIYPTLE